MSQIPTITISPAGAADAYAKVGSGGNIASSSGGGFDGMLRRALGDAVDTGKSAESHAMQAIRGDDNLSQVVTALSRAELTLQTATTIRDRVVQSYQDVMKMPI